MKKVGILLIMLVSISVIADDTVICPSNIKTPKLPNLNNVSQVLGCTDLQEEFEAFTSFEDSIEFPIINSNIQFEYQQRSTKLEEKAKKCQDSRFQNCFPNLLSTISLPKLNNLFTKWINDYRFRYPTGGGACGVRAQNLAHELALKGYKAEVVRIGIAPTLIAMEYDKEKSLNGNFYDYKGSHSLIQIMVKQENGTEEPYLLDPQFMNAPVPKSEYFIKTIGQECHKVDNPYNPPDKSYLNCYYSVSPQNSNDSEISAYKVLQTPSMACGWHFDPSAKEDFANFTKGSVTQANPDRILQILNGDGPVQNDYGKLAGSAVMKVSHKYLILSAYQNMMSRLQKQSSYTKQQLTLSQQRLRSGMFFDGSEEIIRQTIKDLRQDIKIIDKDISYLSKKVEEVKSNLGL